MTSETPDAVHLYLELMKRVLTRIAFPERFREVPRKQLPSTARVMRPLLARKDLAVVQAVEVDLNERAAGRDWPAEAETMIGLPRLDNLEFCIRTVVNEMVPGDLIETGAWRGGASIFMRAVLAALGETSRTVWVADSFEGLPPPHPAHPADAGDKHHTRSALAVSLEEVQSNFRRYGLLDEQVRFLKGWFNDTLPDAPIEELAVIRLDGDMYGSTIDGLKALYPKLSAGGFVIVDDYSLVGAREAVHDYRKDNGISEPIREIDWTGVYWRRAS